MIELADDIDVRKSMIDLFRKVLRTGLFIEDDDEIKGSVPDHQNIWIYPPASLSTHLLAYLFDSCYPPTSGREEDTYHYMIECHSEMARAKYQEYQKNKMEWKQALDDWNMRRIGGEVVEKKPKLQRHVFVFGFHDPCGKDEQRVETGDPKLKACLNPDKWMNTEEYRRNNRIELLEAIARDDNDVELVNTYYKFVLRRRNIRETGGRLLRMYFEHGGPLGHVRPATRCIAATYRPPISTDKIYMPYNIRVPGVNEHKERVNAESHSYLATMESNQIEKCLTLIDKKLRFGKVRAVK